MKLLTFLRLDILAKFVVFEPFFANTFGRSTSFRVSSDAAVVWVVVPVDEEDESVERLDGEDGVSDGESDGGLLEDDFAVIVTTLEGFACK